ncbi:kinase-like domain-containing protein [Dunaliella salina]|uniref:non-specific serine/threonine protein kinase n=1 Tax=Dunaliella salina TaxID=3046 RepID=A0ABQ7GQR9_DUNSA|nr:kinase-like domain-containing protein [Dunaliella salina]|eukprot:KAF5836952.1 kinase-like domain-containing protein [Dunaliella salina]
MNNYADLQPIGQGQYGTAYKARHRLDGQLYCIKRIPMTAKDDHAGALKEVQLLSQLDHPNIIAYKESFVDQEGGLCIVTSFCEEGDLFHRIRSRAKAKEYFSENEIMDMFVQHHARCPVLCFGCAARAQDRAPGFVLHSKSARARDRAVGVVAERLLPCFVLWLCSTTPAALSVSALAVLH